VHGKCALYVGSAFRDVNTHNAKRLAVGARRSSRSLAGIVEPVNYYSKAACRSPSTGNLITAGHTLQVCPALQQPTGGQRRKYIYERKIS
jgi:hypothetical protein